MIRFKHLFGILFCGTLLFFGYNLFVFTQLAEIDNEFEINTHFRQNNLQDWLAPKRTSLPITRWKENRTSGVKQKALKPLVLNECILAENPCIEMLEEIAPARIFWKTASDLITEQHAVEEEIEDAFINKKFKNQFGKTIKSKEVLLQHLMHEQMLLETALHKIPWYYRISCNAYNFWNYTPLTLFTFLHYSHLIAALPEWIKNKLNMIVSWYMEHKYPQIKSDTKKIIKKKTFWLFHGIVDSRVEKTFNELQSKAEKHSYIHDYSPYYRKLRYDFDLEVKNIYHELVRLKERNLALQEIIRR